MNAQLNVDLHSHSLASDGLLHAYEVAARAKAGGVDVWALTDHDETKALGDARAAAEALGMRFINGVEISVSWTPRALAANAAEAGARAVSAAVSTQDSPPISARVAAASSLGKARSASDTTIHIVGLQIDPANPILAKGLKAIRSGRDERAARMALDLEIAGIPGALEGAKKFAVNPELLSRSHFARFLVGAGKATSTHQAFFNYLTEGKPGFVPHQWATLAEAVSWIQAAGGVAVVAHPGRYKQLSQPQLGEFFAEFKDLGGRGIEVMTGSHSASQYDHFAEVARCYGFLASRGSDYHGPGESHVEPGALPPLPADLTPVWHDWF